MNRKFIVSTPTKLVEYMSVGLPVLANHEIIDQKFLIRNSKGGVLSDFNPNLGCQCVSGVGGEGVPPTFG